MEKVGIWAQKTTCHGIVDLYDSKSFLQRVFWGTVVIAAFGAIGFYQYSVISYYLTVPTATKISKITTDKLPFPLVTICNQNIFSMRRYLPIYAKFKQQFPLVFVDHPQATAEQFLGYVAFGAGYFAKLGFSILSGYGPLMVLQYQTIFNSTPPVYTVKQFLNDTGYRCEDFFYECTMTYAVFDCCGSATQIPSDLGNCYELTPNWGNATSTITLNLGQVYQTQQGSDFGMGITLTYNYSDSPNFTDIAMKNEGFEITIGERMTKMNTARVAVAPEQQVSIFVAQQKYQFDSTITTCTDTQSDLAYTVDGKKSVLLCQQECQFNASIKHAGCSRVSPSINMSLSHYCTPLEYLQKYYKEALMIKKEFLSDMFQCQQTKCPKLCNTDLYVPFAVYSGITPGKSSIGINIYYGELAYTLIVEKPLMDLVSLISSFGGNLGLFAGMSLVTIVQFVAHLMYGCGAILVDKKRDNQVKKVPPLATVEDSEKPTTIPYIPRPIYL